MWNGRTSRAKGKEEERDGEGVAKLRSSWAAAWLVGSLARWLLLPPMGS